MLVKTVLAGRARAIIIGLLSCIQLSWIFPTVLQALLKVIPECKAKRKC